MKRSLTIFFSLLLFFGFFQQKRSFIQTRYEDVDDLRNHPAVLYINSGLPVVICPDDPAIWKSTFSHDFYEAFMSWGLDLRCLKQLAMNSLIYSAMEPEEKERALEFWRDKWERFITWLNEYKVEQTALRR